MQPVSFPMLFGNHTYLNAVFVLTTISCSIALIFKFDLVLGQIFGVQHFQKQLRVMLFSCISISLFVGYFWLDCR